jgi:hypothetical protein
MSDELNWRKASLSGSQGGNCVEVAELPDGNRLVRDSKRPDDARLPVSAANWRAFIAAVAAS